MYRFCHKVKSNLLLNCYTKKGQGMNFPIY